MFWLIHVLQFPSWDPWLWDVWVDSFIIVPQVTRLFIEEAKILDLNQNMIWNTKSGNKWFFFIMKKKVRQRNDSNSNNQCNALNYYLNRVNKWYQNCKTMIFRYSWIMSSIQKSYIQRRLTLRDRKYTWPIHISFGSNFSVSIFNPYDEDKSGQGCL